MGASYRRLTLNIGVPMPFVNTDKDTRGRTRYVDAQANLHTASQSSNIFLQVFKSYHITSHESSALQWEQPTAFPYRADLLQYNIGISSLRIMDPGRFSYRAVFNQDAWQKRSQGSWVVTSPPTWCMPTPDWCQRALRSSSPNVRTCATACSRTWACWVAMLTHLWCSSIGSPH
ncbi:MAG: DUF4421 family protein [Flavobacteriales bacterium]|nr:DUF4421 family protein [Flavobacteriales bacterium]MBK7114018.1 DUF4421 family protein [Flavobacteriales bacterium]MBK8707895.1 DUF4421 family protein [Flavobacteriales bacterium]MBK9629021.1 DUF4421 family protein [Flavobacteriales bacterium]